MKNICLVVLMLMGFAYAQPVQPIGNKNGVVKVLGQLGIDTVRFDINPGDTVLYMRPDGLVGKYKLPPMGVGGGGTYDSVTIHGFELCVWEDNFPTCVNLAQRDTVVYAYPLRVVDAATSGASWDTIKIQSSETLGDVLTSGGNINAPPFWAPAKGGDTSWVTDDSLFLVIKNSNGVEKWYEFRADGTSSSGSTPGGSGWLLTGNTGTNPTINFIGTLDNADISFKLFDHKAGYIGRGGNTSLGDSALMVASLNSFSTAFGAKALKENTTGVSNVGIGASALRQNLTGGNNTGVGTSAVRDNTSGTYNTGIGSGALAFNTTGLRNTAVGASTILNNTTGQYNTAIGSTALLRNASGTYNTALGSKAMYESLNLDSSVAIGSGAMYGNSGSGNTAIGSAAMYYSISGGSTAARNVSIGYQNMYSLSTGMYNTGIGTRSGIGLTTGNYNTLIGAQIDLSATPTLSNNILIGDGTGNVRLRINELGQYNIGAGYGTGVHTGISAYSLNVNAAGDVIVGPTGGGSGMPLFTSGSVPFANASGILTEDVGGLGYDGTNLIVGHNNAGVYSGFSINGGRASLQASLYGMLLNVGSGFVPGTYDAVKAYDFQNRGNSYLRMYTTGLAGGPWKHWSDFTTNVRISDTLFIKKPIILETTSNAEVSIFKTRWPDGSPGGLYPWFSITGNSVQSRITMGANNDGSADDMLRLTAGYLPELWTGTYRPFTIRTHDFLAFEASYGTSVVTDPIRFSNNSGRIAIFSNTGSLQVLRSVKIGAMTEPALSAALDVQSNNKGFLPPRMTAAEASAIPSPDEGLLVFVTNTNATFTAKGWWGWLDSAWVKLNN